MIIVDCDQRSDQWYKERLGKPSSSRFDEILTSTGLVSKSRQGYMYELAAQRISGLSPENYTSAAMEEGIQREEESRQLYSMIHDVEVRQVGMIFPDEQKLFLCSPDGIRNDDIGLELKNVLPKTQVEYLLAKKLPVKYFCQIQGSLLVTGFDRWDFLSYSPGLPPFIIECHRDEEWISKCEKELNAFNDELSELVKKIA